MVAQVSQLQKLTCCKALAEVNKFCLSFVAMWLRVPEELEQVFLDEMWLVMVFWNVPFVYLKKQKDPCLIRQTVQGRGETRLLQHRVTSLESWVTSLEPHSRRTYIMQNNFNSTNLPFWPISRNIYLMKNSPKPTLY